MRRSHLQSAARIAAVFTLFFAIYAVAHMLKEGFFGVDPYYHAKHSALLLEHGWTYVGDWVPFHFLTFAPADPWWLYHVATAGMMAVFGTVGGMKVMSAAGAAAVFAAFYAVAGSIGLRRPALWTALLFLSSSAFVMRLLLERPFVWSIAFAVAGYGLLLRKRYVAAGALAFAYMLWYNLAPLLLGIAAAVVFSEWVATRRLDAKPVYAVAGGLLAGIVLHPHSLGYAYVMYIHWIKVLGLKLVGIDLRVGMEIQTLDPLATISNSALLLIVSMLAGVAWWKYRAEGSVREWSLAILAGGWFVVAWFVPRGVEYWAPFGMLFVGSMYERLQASGDGKAIYEQLARFTKPKVVGYVAVGVMASIAAYHLVFPVVSVLRPEEKKRTDLGIAAEWLADNAPAGSVVVYPVWSMFPELFFHNDHARYVTAFDPTFFYDYDAETYYIWSNIAYRGAYCPHAWPCPELTPQAQVAAVPAALRTVLQGSYLIVPEEGYEELRGTVAALPAAFTEAYRNESYVVYELTDQ